MMKRILIRRLLVAAIPILFSVPIDNGVGRISYISTHCEPFSLFHSNSLSERKRTTTTRRVLAKFFPTTILHIFYNSAPQTPLPSTLIQQPTIPARTPCDEDDRPFNQRIHFVFPLFPVSILVNLSRTRGATKDTGQSTKFSPRSPSPQSAAQVRSNRNESVLVCGRIVVCGASVCKTVDIRIEDTSSCIEMVSRRERHDTTRTTRNHSSFSCHQSSPGNAQMKG